MTTENSKSEALDNIANEISACESAVKGTGESINTARVGLMRYHWPFLVISIIVFIWMYCYADFQGLYLAAIGDPTAHSFQSTHEFLAFLVPILINVVGICIAAALSNKKNEKLEKDEWDKRQIIKKCEARIVELKIKQKELQLTPVSEPVENAATAADIKRAQIAADALKRKKDEFDGLEKAIEETQSVIAEVNRKLPLKDHTSMEYFWPWLVTSFIAPVHVYIIAICVIDSYFGLLTDGFVPFLIASACFLLLHIIGGIVARKFARNANLAVAKERDSLDLKLCKLRADLADLEYKKSGLLEEIR